MCRSGQLTSLFLVLANCPGCGFNFSFPGTFSELLPGHSVSSGQAKGLTSRQPSYVHTTDAWILTKSGLTETTSDDDEAFWKLYLEPFESESKSTLNLLNELSGQEVSLDHTMSRYRCWLADSGASRSPSTDALISYKLNDPCSSFSDTFALLQAGDTSPKTNAYFFATVAETLEDSVTSDTDSIHEDMKAFQFQVINSLKFASSTVVFGKIKNVMLVYFHGSITNSDWQSNLTFHLQPADWYEKGSGLVHSGFDQTIQKLWTDIVDIMDDYPDVEKTYFVGFSRGGALASLAALKWSLAGNSSRAYTFGQPRFADKQLREFISSRQSLRIIRIVNSGDIVARLPPLNSSLHFFNFLFKL